MSANIAAGTGTVFSNVTTRPAFGTRAGTISLWINPYFSSGDSNTHFVFSSTSAGGDPTFQKFSDNNIYAGFNGAQRIIIPDTGLFNAGQWAHWVLKYTDPAGGVTSLYKNAILLGTQAMSSQAVGNGWTVGSGASSGPGLIAHLAAWNTGLHGTELVALAGGANPLTVRRGSLVLYVPLDQTMTDRGPFVLNGANVGITFSSNNPLVRSPMVAPPVRTTAFVPGAVPRLPMIGVGSLLAFGGAAKLIKNEPQTRRELLTKI